MAATPLLPAASPRAGLTAAFRRLGVALVCGVLPVAALVAVTVTAGHGFAYDFHLDLYNAAHLILDGGSPWPVERVAAVADAVRRGLPAPSELAVPCYPAPVQVLFVPFALLPSQLASGLFVALLVPVPALALRLVGVRDWRVLGIAYLCLGVLHGITLGTLSPLLLLAVACVFRYRDGRWAAPAALAAAVAAKLFLWPLGVWLLATRRTRSAFLSVGLAVAAAVVGWALIGFRDLGAYPSFLDDLSAIEQGRSYSLVGAALNAGLDPAAARRVAAGAGLALLLSCIAVGRRPRGDLASFALALAAALVLTPIVWLHYLPLMLVPLAIAHPRLGPVWVAPLALWLTPNETTVGHPWWFALAASLVAFVCAAATLAPWPAPVAPAGTAAPPLRGRLRRRPRSA